MLKRLEIENFGPFRGRHYLSLETDNKLNAHKPIIIIGGKNGTGKTTLFEAIKICLYGKFFKGKRLSDTAYIKFINQKFHRYPDGNVAQYASVAIEFDYAKLGYVDNYFVKRSWKRLPSQVIEELRVERNGKLLDDVDEDQWQEFLLELVPLGVSKFFFFDGEQIQKLAKEKYENEYILNSINSLLGIEIVERLRSDLEIYASRKIKNIDSQIELKIQECLKRKNLLEKKLSSVLERKSLLKRKISQLQEAIESQEIKIAMEGGSFASKREKLKNRKKEIDEEIEHIKDQIRGLCSNLLPFAYAPELCYNLKKRLEQEEEAEQRLAAIGFLSTMLDSITPELENSSIWDLLKVSVDEKHKMLRTLLDELRKKLESRNTSCGEIIHPLSSVERREMLKWIEEALNDVPLQLAKLSMQLERLVRDRQKIEKFLFSVPSDDVIHPLIRKLGELHEKLGKNQQKLSLLEEKERQIKNELTQVDRELKKMFEEKARSKQIREKLSLLENVQNALSEYLNNLREEKMNEFRKNLLYCLNILFNKRYLIKDVNIDPLTFEINLISDDGAIPTDSLSAGEKQIYAISLCWALARTSRRPIPFIIDTPLGRLDKEHRRNVIERFFSNASHQIIVFSTDTEIDAMTFNTLKRDISRAYHLTYNENDRATYIKEGYFSFD